MDDDTILGSEEDHDKIIDVEGLDTVQFAIRLVDVSRIYDLGKRKVQALNDVNLEVRSGEFIVISGHSGSGKTTLLNVIGAIDYISKGRVSIMDVPIEDYDEAFRSTFRLSNIGYMFQSYNLISTLTALENIMFPMQLVEMTRVDLEERAHNLLKMVKLDEWANHLPWQLSSGEQQRVALARALANKPPIILADEPTANLDKASAQMVRDLLCELNKGGTTIVVMTHDEEIARVQDAHLFKMDTGVLTELFPDE